MQNWPLGSWKGESGFVDWENAYCGQLQLHWFELWSSFQDSADQLWQDPEWTIHLSKEYDDDVSIAYCRIAQKLLCSYVMSVGQRKSGSLGVESRFIVFSLRSSIVKQTCSGGGLWLPPDTHLLRQVQQKIEIIALAEG